MGNICPCFRSKPPPDHPQPHLLVPRPNLPEDAHHDVSAAPPPPGDHDAPKSVKGVDTAEQGLDDDLAHDKSANHNHHDPHDEPTDQKKSPLTINGREAA
ncbi:hypothetical protein TIFTF001_031441 [Ficus carica]|uniref:Uncharacterized protein n=1 Tax=Ficus carica TaxID=3494 RepID=A0AA88DWY1_FICCA|nr:hypothetical protein TIFTF001_031441 [Ficus carica]